LLFNLYTPLIELINIPGLNEDLKIAEKKILQDILAEDADKNLQKNFLEIFIEVFVDGHKI